MQLNVVEASRLLRCTKHRAGPPTDIGTHVDDMDLPVCRGEFENPPLQGRLTVMAQVIRNVKPGTAEYKPGSAHYIPAA
jgi:hypothetical protein